MGPDACITARPIIITIIITITPRPIIITIIIITKNNIGFQEREKA
jgi:hypothetical protein